MGFLKLEQYRLGIIGIGNMGYALAKGVMDSGLLKKKELWGFDVSKKRCRKAIEDLDIYIPEDPCQEFDSTKYLLFAVKPQNLGEMLSSIKNRLVKQNVIISVLAGISTRHIEEKILPGIGVFRVMPNAPALLRKGVAAVCMGTHARREDEHFVKGIMESVGECVIVDEGLMNAVTAISGSGPAYFFIFCKYLFEAARSLGIDDATAKTLVNGTISGAAAMVNDPGYSYSDLASMVTSPGGTTEKALKEFEIGKFEELVKKAAAAADKRAFELEESVK